MTESQSPIFGVSTSNTTLRQGVSLDVSHHVSDLDGLLADHDQLLSAMHSRTPDESPNSIVFESPQSKLQTGKYNCELEISKKC